MGGLADRLARMDVAAMRTIAALYVEHGGTYYGLDGVEPWGLPERDAREYAGPHPVVAHPPCSRWCRLAGLVEARWGHKKGDDGGHFAAALAAVRKFGGVLEHPAWSDAWEHFGLVKPMAGLPGWLRADTKGGHTCYVEQGRFGHPAKKATWLYACRAPLLDLRWGAVPDKDVTALVSWCGNRVRSNETRPRLGKKRASRTPTAFRDELIAMARGVA